MSHIFRLFHHRKLWATATKYITFTPVGQLINDAILNVTFGPMMPTHRKDLF
jgi:hypothetical protein